MGWARRLEDRQERYCLKPGSWLWQRQRCQSRLGQWIWVPCKLQRREAVNSSAQPTMNPNNDKHGMKALRVQQGHI